MGPHAFLKGSNNMEKTKCSHESCGENAIGYQADSFSGLKVCENHARRPLLQMNSGEKKTMNGWYYHKY